MRSLFCYFSSLKDTAGNPLVTARHINTACSDWQYYISARQLMSFLCADPLWSRSSAVLITLQGVSAEVTWLAREYACACCVIKVHRNAGVGLEKQLDHEKGLSVCWSTRAQRPHIVCQASAGLLYCPLLSHLPFTLLRSHAPEKRKKVAFHSWVTWSMHRNSMKRGASQLATTAFYDLEPFPSNKQLAWTLQSDSLPPAPPGSSEQGAKDQSECNLY